MKVLAEIPPRPSPDLRTGTLRRRDLEAFGGLLDELEGTQTVLTMGSARRDVALGLATVAVARGLRAVLVECDIAEPTLAESLGLAIAPGLHEYLRGQVDAAGILKPVALAGPGSAEASEPLVCIVAGRPARNAEILLASGGLDHVIDGLRSVYDRVVISGPEELVSILPQVDSRIACLDSSESQQKFTTAVDGFVIQN